MFLHIRRRFVRGLLAVLPLLFTVWLLKILFDLINDNITPWVVAVFRTFGSPDLDRWQARVGFPVIGFLLTVLTVYLVGVIATNLAGRRLFLMIEAYILRIPLVRRIYGSARQLIDAFRVGNRTFSKVVLVEYPRPGLWTAGFVTAEEEHLLFVGNGSPEKKGHVPVFLPTTPNPTSGWMVLAPREDLQVLDMTIEEGLKFIVSGGIVSPGDLGGRLSLPAAGDRGRVP